MPLYLVERTFVSLDQFDIPGADTSRKIHQGFAENNAMVGVKWLHSYVTPAQRKVFCLYEGLSPEAVRRAAGLNGLPVDRSSEVRELNSISGQSIMVDLENDD